MANGCQNLCCCRMLFCHGNCLHLHKVKFLCLASRAIQKSESLTFETSPFILPERMSLHPPRLGRSRARWGRRRSWGPLLTRGCRRWRGWCAACGGPSRLSLGLRSYTRQSCSGWRRTAHPAKRNHKQGFNLRSLASNRKCSIFQVG